MAGHVTSTVRVNHAPFSSRFLLRVGSSPSSQNLHGSVPPILQRSGILPAALRRPAVLFRPSRAAPACLLLLRLPATPAQRPDGPAQFPRPPGTASVRPCGGSSRRLRPPLRQQESVAPSGEPPPRSSQVATRPPRLTVALVFAVVPQRGRQEQLAAAGGAALLRLPAPPPGALQLPGQ